MHLSAFGAVTSADFANSEFIGIGISFHLDKSFYSRNAVSKSIGSDPENAVFSLNAHDRYTDYYNGRDSKYASQKNRWTLKDGLQASGRWYSRPVAGEKYNGQINNSFSHKTCRSSIGEN